MVPRCLLSKIWQGFLEGSNDVFGYIGLILGDGSNDVLRELSGLGFQT